MKTVSEEPSKSGTRSWPLPLFWLLLILLLVLDQSTKCWFMQNYWPGKSSVVIPGFLNLTYVRNDGMAFGLFQGNNFRLGLMACLVLALAFVYARTLNWRLLEPNITGALFLAGATGNLADRFRHGFVVDFADFYIGQWHWPAFNVADSCITLVVLWLFLRTTVLTGPRVDQSASQA